MKTMEEGSIRGALGTSRNSPPRQIMMADLMIMVMGVAAGCGLARASLDGPTDARPVWSVALILTCGLVWSLTPIVVILRLRQPVRFRQVTREPGFVACAVGTAVEVLSLVAIGIVGIVRFFKEGTFTLSGRPALQARPGWWLEVLVHFDKAAGPAILGAWLLLLVSGRRRLGRTWLDPCGRVLGTLWILMFVASCCVQLARTID